MKKIFAFLAVIIVYACSVDDSNQSAIESLNGSYTKMLILDSYLYAVNDQDLISYDISNSEKPIKIHEQELGFNIENITHNEGLLLIGSQTIMYIFEINANGVPEHKSSTNYFDTFEVTACDPVIAKGQYAYVTLSTTANVGPCGQLTNINQLRVYDILDIENPILVKEFDLENPKGLAIDGDYLFVCESNNGFKVFSIADPLETELIQTYDDGNESFDVIANNDLLTIVSPTELRQYNYSNIDDIQYLSRIDL